MEGQRIGVGTGPSDGGERAPRESAFPSARDQGEGHLPRFVVVGIRWDFELEELVETELAAGDDLYEALHWGDRFFSDIEAHGRGTAVVVVRDRLDQTGEYRPALWPLPSEARNRRPAGR